MEKQRNQQCAKPQAPSIMPTDPPISLHLATVFQIFKDWTLFFLPRQWPEIKRLIAAHWMQANGTIIGEARGVCGVHGLRVYPQNLSLGHASGGKHVFC